MYVLGNYKIYPWKSSEKKTLLPKSAAKVQQIFEMCKILAEKIIDLHSKEKISRNRLYLCKGVFSIKRLTFAQKY